MQCNNLLQRDACLLIYNLIHVLDLKVWKQIISAKDTNKNKINKKKNL